MKFITLSLVFLAGINITIAQDYYFPERNTEWQQKLPDDFKIDPDGLKEAVAFAEAVASGPLDFATNRVGELSERHRLRSRYSRFWNRLLFRLVAPRHRHQIFRRFYRVLSDASIERFYSHQFTAGDAIRIVVGIPPTLTGLRPQSFIRSFFPGDES